MSFISVLFLLAAVSCVSLASYEQFGRRGYYCPRHCYYNRYHFDCYRCRRYYVSQSDVPTCAKWMWWGKDENCAKVVERFGLKDVKELEELNNNLQCSSDSKLFDGQQMCVKKLKEGAVSKSIFCDKYMVASAGDTCDLVEKKLAVEWDIAALNPEVNCDKLIEGEVLCGKYFVAPICQSFHIVKKSDETCKSVVEERKLRGLATLNTLNADLDCQKPMEVGRMLCIGIISNDD